MVVDRRDADGGVVGEEEAGVEGAGVDDHFGHDAVLVHPFEDRHGGAEHGGLQDRLGHLHGHVFGVGLAGFLDGLRHPAGYVKDGVVRVKVALGGVLVHVGRGGPVAAQHRKGHRQGFPGVGVLVDDEAVQLRQLRDGADEGRDDDIHKAHFAAFRFFGDHVARQGGVVHLVGQHDLGVRPVGHDVRHHADDRVVLLDEVSV